MAVLSGDHRANSLGAIRECFERNVERIEIDIHSLDGPDYVVFHERRLERETTGTGSIGHVSPDDVRASRYLDRPDERPPLLSEVIDLARSSQTQLQLDLKDWRLMPPERLAPLAELVAPLLDRVVVSTGQDWNLARLHAAHPEIRFGFDPGHYLDYALEGAGVFLPRAMGAYGYRDDHPLALGRTQTTAEYLEARFEMLLRQLPAAREYFLNYRLVLQMLDDGFDAAAWLHARGIGANVWTLDDHGDASRSALERVVAAGIDRVTTNTARAWQAMFS